MSVFKVTKKLFLLIFLLVGLIIYACSNKKEVLILKNIRVCNQMGTNACLYDETNIGCADEQIIASCTLENVEPNTRIVFTWIYLAPEPLVIKSTTVNSGEEKDVLNVFSKLSKPINGWPKGKYAIQISVNKNKKTKTRYFEVL